MNGIGDYAFEGVLVPHVRHDTRQRDGHGGNPRVRGCTSLSEIASKNSNTVSVARGHPYSEDGEYGCCSARQGRRGPSRWFARGVRGIYPGRRSTPCMSVTSARCPTCLTFDRDTGPSNGCVSLASVTFPKTLRPSTATPFSNAFPSGPSQYPPVSHRYSRTRSANA